MWKLSYRILELDGTLEHSYSRPLGPQRGKPGGEVMCQGQMLGGARWQKRGIRGHIGTKGGGGGGFPVSVSSVPQVGGACVVQGSLPGLPRGGRGG